MRLCSYSCSSLEGVEVVHVDGVEIAEQHHQDGEPYGRLGRGNGQDEEDEHLAADVLEVEREREEVEVDREQHELDGHQQDDHVLAVEKYPDHADGEQDRSKHQVMRQ